MSVLLDPSSLKIKVSSTLNKDTKSFGKHFLTDGSAETCWNSDQGQNQWISVALASPKRVASLSVGFMFQGGFSSNEVQVLATLDADAGSDWTSLTVLYPSDSNDHQLFPLVISEDVSVQSLKFVFASSTDTYGRIVVYKFEIWENK
ncbi:Nuclear receptor 2C2-associated protein [Entophlyctis luteolus]|nr:Nuclear receptor 2C2-associated protein [Entophlyctis luteolus]